MKLEVCVADPASLAAAIEGGADRIELCSGLELGGLTPSPGLMRLAARAPVPVYALVRPRPGDFVYGAAEREALLADIDAIRAAGLAGVVIGASRPDGALDLELLARLIQQAEGLGTTLHRAFDLVPNVTEATEAAVSLGFERILTSGGARRAVDGIARLGAAHAAARGRIAIMAGSGLDPGNVADLLRAVPVDEIHSSCAAPVPAQGEAAIRLGFAAPQRRQTQAEIVVAMREALAAA